MPVSQIFECEIMIVHIHDREKKEEWDRKRDRMRDRMRECEREREWERGREWGSISSTFYVQLLWP